LTTQQTVPYRPLGLLKNLTETLGFTISHCYEELVFIEHNALLLRMEEVGKKVSLFFNDESDTDKRDGIADVFIQEGQKQMLEITQAGTYKMKANETDGTLDIEFAEYSKA
jgi:hypothetical protein